VNIVGLLAKKKRLEARGVDVELVRLFCRHMVNPRNERAEQRFWKRHNEFVQKALKASQ
jgi:hypothetical protein